MPSKEAYIAKKASVSAEQTRGKDFQKKGIATLSDAKKSLLRRNSEHPNGPHSHQVRSRGKGWLVAAVLLTTCLN